MRRYQQVAFRAAYLVTRSAADAEDAAQEGFVKAWYAMSRFRPGARFRPWLLRIVTNEARNRRRSAFRRERLALRAAGTASEHHGTPEEAALLGERRRALLAAIDRLPARDRSIIGYRYLLELSEEETAAALGVAVGTVKSRLSRARHRLRNLLADQPAEPEGRP